ncbi:MAG: ATP synthase F0 subunit B [Myxococcales bacterium]|nr:ATP synthase F0 subunit B [Myxococcales bacterium]MCB9713076.1 ATP synthase F0 subunit B [Myxococcales bacterium]
MKVSRIAAPIAAALAMLPAVALANPEAEGHGGIEWITPVFGSTGKLGLVWIIINFLALLWILNRILFQPLIKRTRDKHDTVKGEIDKATAAREEAEGVLAEYRGRLDELDQEVDALMSEAKERAEADRKRIIEAAEREAEQIKASAKAAAEREAAARRRQLEAEIIDRAVERAEALLRQKITPADQLGMVDRYAEQLGSVDFGGAAR